MAAQWAVIISVMSGADLLQPSPLSYSPHSGLAERSNIASASPLPPQPPATQADHNR
ncbi:hypothetical protein PGTUg99_035159 [Puccinia graminis f. sp. tritici]|uniref:Uncharacterized protein n=1 Tax=Puccinia graminis f. sp. tritici TaxID=56615 RepID=A0A5B0NNI2_PUCGR|nr:hypothetical protein PGTUg99_035159 [Puccinia graminis f. sp. tritici]